MNFEPVQKKGHESNKVASYCCARPELVAQALVQMKIDFYVLVKYL
jgi:hypothetical protein